MSRLLIVVLSFVPSIALAGDIFTSPTASDIPALVRCLEDANVRYGASNALVQLGRPAVEELKRAIMADSVELRIWAAYTLGRIGSDALAAIPPLTDALKTEDRDLRATAARALGQIGDADIAVIEGLAAALSDDEVRVRQSATDAIAQIGAPAQNAVPQLIVALRDQSIRKQAIEALTRIGPAATPALITALDDNDVRLEAAEALRQLDPAAAREARVDSTTLADLAALKQSLENRGKDREARIGSARELGKLGADGISILIRAFSDDDQEVARASIRAFQYVGAAGVSALQEALQDESPRIRAAAADALAAIGPEAKPAVMDLARLLEDADRDVRFYAAASLDELGTVADEAAATLIAVVQNEREQEPTRQLAIKALGQSSPAVRKQVVAELEKVTKVGNFGVSSLARETLGRLAGKDSN